MTDITIENGVTADRNRPLGDDGAITIADRQIIRDDDTVLMRNYSFVDPLNLEAPF